MARPARALCATALLAVSALAPPGPGGAAERPDAPLALVEKAARLEAACADANSDYERSELGCPADEEPDGRALLDD